MLGTSAEGGPEEVSVAVASARRAFGSWSGAPLEQRLEVLRGWVGQLEARRDLLVDTIVAEVGAPVALAREAHVGMALDVLRAYLLEFLLLALKLAGERLRLLEQVFRTHVGFDRVEHDADAFGQLIEEGQMHRTEAVETG